MFNIFFCMIDLYDIKIIIIVIQMYLTYLFVQVKRPTIIVGEMSSGKTATMKCFIRNLEPKNYVNINLIFSSKSTFSLLFISLILIALTMYNIHS